MGDAINNALEVGISYRRGYLDGFRDGSAARSYNPKLFDVDAYAKKLEEPVEPVASMRIDVLEQTRELMHAYYSAIERELEYHINAGRIIQQRAIPPHGSMILGMCVTPRNDIDETLSLICIEVDSIDTPVIRVVVQRRVL